MSNFGALDLRVVTPFERAFREAVSAVGAAPVLAKAQEFATVEQAIRDCSLVVGTTAIGNRDLRHPLHSLDAAAKKIRRSLRSSRVAVLFGSEKTGLSNHDLSYFHWLLRIPTRPEHRSMNLAHAVAIVVYELAGGGAAFPSKNKAGAQRSPGDKVLTGGSSLVGPAGSHDADMETLARINEALREALDASGYIHPRSAASAEEKLRRMLLRIHLNATDANVLLGMLRKILWKLQS